jgi:RNA-directed DNA polymerase
MEKGILQKWLKCGFMEKQSLYPTKAGTPQGSLCKALHNPPYAKKVIMQSKELYPLQIKD